MSGTRWVVFGLCLALPAVGESKWEPQLKAFAAADAEQPPAPGGVLFLGSSSIRMWDLERWFGDLDALNRGFGGSQISDSIELFDRLVLPYQPRQVIFYAGDNDLAGGKSPAAVRDDYLTFATRLHEALPEAELIFLSVKPSRKRWALIDQIREANRLIRDEADRDPKAVFLELGPPMLGADGTPRRELFREDGLHLSDTGYQLWTELVEPLLQRR